MPCLSRPAMRRPRVAWQTSPQRPPRLAAGQNVQAFGSLGRILGKPVVNQARKWLREVLGTAAAQADIPAGEEAAAAASLPTIVVSDRRLHDITGDGLAALPAVNEPPLLFGQGPRVVRLARGPDGRLRIERVNEHAPSHDLVRAADFVVARGQGKAHVAPRWTSCATSGGPRAALPGDLRGTRRTLPAARLLDRQSARL